MSVENVERTVTAADCRLVRDLTGLGMMQAKEIMRLAGEEAFGGDVVLAARYVDAMGLAVHVKGDRKAWAMSRARTMAEADREAGTGLSEAFPAPAAGGLPSP